MRSSRFPKTLRPLLEPLSLHERYLDCDFLEAISKEAEESWTRAQIDRCAALLCTLGMLTDQGQAIYELHPLFTRYLRWRIGEPPESWRRGFVTVMAQLADHYAPRQLHEQRPVFYLHSANFQSAADAAAALEMPQAGAALTQSLAAYALEPT